MKKILKYIFTVAGLLIISCSNDAENDLIEVVDQETPISYNVNVRPILNNNCVSCHSNPTQNGAPFPLTNYNEVLTRAQNGQLFTSINRQTGQASAMPPSGRMPQATIDLIEQWIQEGGLED
jgi:uncharacterized membrane protein